MFAPILMYQDGLFVRSHPGIAYFTIVPFLIAPWLVLFSGVAAHDDFQSLSFAFYVRRESINKVPAHYATVEFTVHVVSFFWKCYTTRRATIATCQATRGKGKSRQNAKRDFSHSADVWVSHSLSNLSLLYLLSL